MKRTLISHDAFKDIQNNSLSNSERELLEAEPLLAKALQAENLQLVCYGPETVMFESETGEYVRANYSLNNNTIEFDNIEQLVVDEESESVHSRELLKGMLDAVLDGNDTKAEQIFGDYITHTNFKRSLSEAVVHKVKKKKAPVAKKSGKNPRAALKFKSGTDKKKKLKEWQTLVENVMGYADYKAYGRALKESVATHDDKGNIIALRVPNVQARNEAKVLSFNWKTLDTDVKVLRGGAKHLSENAEFCKAIAGLKRNNAFSDQEKLQEGLEDIVTRWSNILYLTQNELSAVVAEALNTVGAKNFDDQTCDFIAEALLVTAHNSYVDRVSKILGLAGTKVEENTDDAYDVFKAVVDQFYPSLDESAGHEMQVYVDLYETLRGVYSMAAQANNEFVKKEAGNHLSELAAIIEQNVEPSLDVAVAAAEWLNNLAESNLEGEDWNVSNNVHTTVSGDHPITKTYANKGYTPSSDFSGNYGDPAPVSDGKSYRNGLAGDMRNNSWGNLSGDGIYPSLTNPYIPKPFGDYKIKGEKFIDSDSDQLAHWSSGDTWPALQNPVVPKAETPKTYQMNHDKGDLIVNK